MFNVKHYVAHTAALVANGSNGSVRVAGPSSFVRGMLVSLAATGVSATGVQISDVRGVVGTTHVDLILVDATTGAIFDATPYTTALSGAITAAKQSLWFDVGVDSVVSGIFTDADMAAVLGNILPGGTSSLPGAGTSGPIYVANAPGTSVTVFNAVNSFSNRFSAAVDSSKWNKVSGNIKSDTGAYINGTFYLQGTQDPLGLTGWATVSGASVAAATLVGNPGFNLPLVTAPHRWLRGVWVSAQNATQNITCGPDIAGSLTSRYFLISGRETFVSPWPFFTYPNGFGYAFWFRVSGAGSPPVIPGYAAAPIDIAMGASAATVATAVATAMGTLGVARGVAFTSDGVNFTESVLGNSGVAVNNSASYVAYGNGVYCLMPGNGAFAAGRTWTSSDGITWDVHSGGGIPTTAKEMIFCGGTINLFIAITSNQILSSPDGVTWTNRQATGLTGCVGFDSTNSRIVVLLQSGTTGYISTNGTSFSTVTVTNANWAKVAWNGAIWAAIVSGSTVYMSSLDGTTWNARTGISLNSPSLAASPLSGRFVVAQNVSQNIAVSTDAINWTPMSLPTAGGVVSWDPVNSRFASVTSNNLTLLSTTGLVWVPTFASNTNAMTGAQLLLGNGGLLVAATAMQIDFNAASDGAVVSVVCSGPGGAIPAVDGDTGFTFAQVVPPLTTTITASIYGI